MSEVLIVERHGAVLFLQLNRPAKRNALNQELVATLIAALDAAESDLSVACVVVTAAGSVFCAGADLGEVSNFASESAAESETRLARTANLYLIMSRMTKTVIVAVQGAAVGAGASLALSADLVISGESGSFSYPEVPHGLIPNMVMPTLLAATTPRAAFAMLALGDTIDAATALSLGLVNKVVPDSMLNETTRMLAERLAGHDRASLAATKSLFKKIVGLPLENAMNTAQAVAMARLNDRGS